MWQETVITKFQREVVWGEPLIDKEDTHDLHIAKFQAQISYKAGIEKVVKDIEDCFEVKNSVNPDWLRNGIIIASPEQWQRFKESLRQEEHE